MTENKSLKLALLLGTVAASLGAAPVRAETAASFPGLSHVNELLVHNPRFGNKEISKKCGVMSHVVLNDITKALKEHNLPVFSLLEAKDPDPGAVRIYILPEITTLAIQSSICASYISLTAKSYATLKIPPIDIPRKVEVVYWSAGIMVNSSVAGHPNLVKTKLEQLSTAFQKSYDLAQPPSFKDKTTEIMLK